MSIYRTIQLNTLSELRAVEHMTEPVTDATPPSELHRSAFHYALENFGFTPRNATAYAKGLVDAFETAECFFAVELKELT